MSGWDSCTHEPSAILRWIECHQGLSGYLQAIGVVVAIAGSAWVAWFSTLRPQEQEREHRARVLSYRLLPIIKQVAATAERIKVVAQQTDYGCKLAEDGKTELAEWSVRIDTSIPDDAMVELHVLSEDASNSVAKLHFGLSEFNNNIRTNLPIIRSLPASAVATYRSKFNELLVAVAIEAMIADAELYKIAKTKPHTVQKTPLPPNYREPI